MTGGVVGSFFMSMKKGVSRGIFSNEAGLGTGSIAHACADTKKPVKQGFFGIFEVFVDTIIICTMTALVILCSGVPVNYGEAAGAELTISGFTTVYGNWVSIFTAVAMCCFAFSTIMGWYFFGEQNVRFLFRSRGVLAYRVIVCAFIVTGAMLKVDFVWSLADLFNGLMVLPNLVALVALHKVVGESLEDFEKKLDEVYITVNKNAIPNDPQKPGVTSGVRIGTPACTTRGFTPEDMPVVADCIDKIATDYEANREAVLAAVAELVRKHPIYE